MNIIGKTALVTGGAIRVGKAISLGLAQAGANMVINYSSNSQKALETAQEIEKLGVTALTIQANVADWEQVKLMFAEIHEKIGKIDILVNNASPFTKTPIPTDSIEAWHQVTGVQINGAFYVSNLAAKDMLEKKEGAIVNIIDLSAWEAWPNLTAHVVGKSALLALTRQFALELHPYVRVNAIAPGPVLPPPDYSEEKINRTAAKTLLNRWGTAEDISKTVNFLIESDYINAEFIAVDGGQRFAHRKYEEG
ncbi:MAG: short-chain dehydrogenase [Chloroflexi bacterium HGW-Chloroflexi-10]|nr:MAG: short-chain dehydrogenase [Chloroflexi bacterium HGW-Chloroflexi-10]